MKKSVLFLFVVGFAVQSAWAAATITEVTVRQLWPWSKKVVVTYTLDTDAPVDIDVRVTRGGQPVVVAPASLNGDLCAVESGAHTLYWDPTVTFPNEELVPDIAVTVEPTTAKTYMIVDLSDNLANTAAARITYTNEVIGSKTASNADATWKLWDDYYKTNAIVLRRCLAGTFQMGTPAAETGHQKDEILHTVQLTKNFYMGVFEVTQAQYKKLNGGVNPSNFKGLSRDDMRPVEKTTWTVLRTASWPENPASAMTTGPIAQLSALVGNEFHFDLPTEAQWEYACRAGTTTALPNGKELTCGYYDKKDAALDTIARYLGNKTNEGSDANIDPAEGGTALVGSYQPNDWGLFDVIGNVWEWCLDWKEDWTGISGTVVDPVGAATGTTHPRRGGSHIKQAGYFYSNRSGAREATTPTDAGHYQGFRLCLTLN